jgi:hypothetical protein
MTSIDHEQGQERERVKAKLRQGVAWLFIPNLVACFEQMKSWDWDEFNAWTLARDFDEVVAKVKILSSDEALRDFIWSKGPLDDVRTIYEALTLMEQIIDDPGYYGSDYRTLAAQIRFSISVRDLCTVALMEWEKLP